MRRLISDPQEEAIYTIRALQFKCTKTKALKQIEYFLKLLNQKYPLGFNNVEKSHFTMPGFEHVTRKQPIAKYDSQENKWVIKTYTIFNFLIFTNDNT
jgi:hypothetical protein